MFGPPSHTRRLLPRAVFAHVRGRARCSALAGKLRIRLLARLIRTPAFTNLHEGFAMLAHPVWLGAGVLLRVSDLLVHAARFMLVAKLVGIVSSEFMRRE